MTLTESPHFPRLDGLRAIAALAVFFTHVSFTKYRPGFPVKGFDNVVASVLNELTVGVQIFFGVSGFVLMRPFVARHVAGRSTLRGSGYLVRRLFRIYPAYWFALLGTTFVIRGVVHLHGLGGWIQHLLLVQGYFKSGQFGPGFMGMIQAWTLVVEVSFYLFLALYCVVLRKVAGTRNALDAQRWGLVILAAVTVGLNVWSRNGQPPVWATLLSDQMPYFLCGMTAAVVSVHGEHTRHESAGVRFLGRYCGSVALLSLAAFVVASILHVQGNPAWLWSLFLRLVIVGSLLSLAIHGDATNRFVLRILESRVAVFLGTVSYGIYLWHYSIVFWVSDHWVTAAETQTMVKVTAYALPATLLMSWLSYRLVEKNAIRVGRRLTRSIRA